MSTFATDIKNGDGSTVVFTLSFPFLSRDDVTVSRLEETDPDTAVGTPLTVIQTGPPTGNQFQWQNNSTVQVGTAPAASQRLRFRRDTPDNEQVVQWDDGSYLVATDLNTSDQQWLYLIQELDDRLKIDEAKSVGEAPDDGIQYGRQSKGWTPTLPEAPNDGKEYARKNEAWAETAGFPEAPQNSKTYGRENAAWKEVEGFPEAPQNSVLYGRENAQWVQVPASIPDAPNNGIIYGRQNQDWVEVETGGGIVYKGTRDLTQPAPNSPEDGDFYINIATSGTVHSSWTGIAGEALTGSERVIYNGSTWDLLPSQEGGGASVEVSDTAPSNPSEGDLWWDSSADSGQLYIYYVDDDSSQWVEANTSSGGGGGGGSSLWKKDGTTLSPLELTDNVSIGGNNIALNTNGDATYIGNVFLNGDATKYMQAPNVIAESGYTGARQALNGDTYNQYAADGSTLITLNEDLFGSSTFGKSVTVKSTTTNNADLFLTNQGADQFRIGLNPTAAYFTKTVTGPYVFYNSTSAPSGEIRFGDNGSAQFPGPVKIGGTAEINEMNKFEDGTWTPTIGGDATFNIQWGRYVRSGSFVQCWGGLRPTSIGSGNPRTIQGLPYPASGSSGGTSQGGGSIVWCDGAAVDFYSAVITVNNTSLIADINLKTGANKVLGANHDFWTVNFRANFYICYFTDD